ncbi:hypothetical protein HD597_000316 [Nonomuraea thailandensis]|uniref:Uncharacterized protein n=1 Tax=Nonomuraea thailandensis TaxID=1188745 RepID=A0A9X2GDF8_9ACTN|nr:hypothetical protein [Nonomuraea thailandensis]
MPGADGLRGMALRRRDLIEAERFLLTAYSLIQRFSYGAT